MAKTAILVLQQTNTLSLAAAVDPLRAANRHRPGSAFDWQFITPDSRDVTLTCGLTVPAAPIHRVNACDVLIVVAGFDLQAQSTPRLMSSLRRLARPGIPVIAIDGGPWVLANAGLLDGHQATTHWEDLETFANSFPDVDTINARYVVSRSRWTSGGAAPALDMMLHLIRERNGAALAAQVAASFIHTSQPAPSDPQMRHPPALPHSAVTARAQRVMEAHLDTPMPLPQIAKRLGISPRSLQQHFRAALGATAKAHYTRLRLMEARRLISDTDRALGDVALATGFPTAPSFSRAYRAHFGVAPNRTRKTRRATS
jgi:transcriptional regulator GlxA family with amidase domain